MTVMRKTVLGALAALALVVGTATAFAAPGTATGNVNVRTGPGTNYARVDTLYRGERVDVQQCRGNWCYIVKRGTSGWVSASYLAMGGAVRPERPQRPYPGVKPPYWGNQYRPPAYPHRPPPPRPQRPWGGQHHYDNSNQGSVCFNGPNGYFCVGN